MNLTEEVRAFWEATPCGTDEHIVGRVSPLTPYDVARFPGWLARPLPDSLGWFIAVQAAK